MTRSFRRTAGAVLAMLGLVLSVVSLVASPAAADSHGDSPSGNNGTIKVDEQGIENGPGAPNSNDPHIACVGRVEYYGIDGGPQDTELIFEVQPPTLGTAPDGTDTVKTYDAVITGNGPGGPELDGSIDFDLTDLLASYEPHPRQGYHVKVTTHTTFSRGSDTKHKVFWVAPCPGEEDEFGALQVSKDVAGDDAPAQGTLFGFTVACTHDGQPVDLTDGDDSTTVATFSLAHGQQSELFDLLPVGASCTITEADDGDADSTEWTVDGSAAEAQNGPTGEFVIVTISGNSDIRVQANNVFNMAGQTGGFLVDKELAGDGQPTTNPAFGFSVDCDGTAFDRTFTLTATGAAEVFSGIPAGTSCTITETDRQGATSLSWTGGGTVNADGSLTLTVGDATNPTFTATNLFEEEVGGVVTRRPPVVTPPVVTPPVVNPPVVTPPLGPTPEVTPPAPPTPPAPTVIAQQRPPEQILGNVVRRDLPRTGNEPLPLLETGLGMILLGSVLAFGGRRQRRVA